MPELPEVETVRRIVGPQIVGQTILSVNIGNPQVIAYPNECQFVRSVTGQKIKNMSRRGKFLTVDLESGDRIVIHLRMTGQLLVTPVDHPIEKHTHVIMELSGNDQLRYIDVRRFGRFWFLRADEEDTVTGQDKLGLEPLDNAMAAEYLKMKLGSRRKTIKEALLDQSIVAGIGNIYSDEILYEACICPEESCVDLKDPDWNILIEKIKEVITWGIETNAMGPEEYLMGKGKEYRNTPDLRIYGREWQPCKRCQTTIVRAVIGGRSSCYCPSCQRKGP